MTGLGLSKGHPPPLPILRMTVNLYCSHSPGPPECRVYHVKPLADSNLVTKAAKGWGRERLAGPITGSAKKEKLTRRQNAEES